MGQHRPLRPSRRPRCVHEGGRRRRFPRRHGVRGKRHGGRSIVENLGPPVPGPGYRRVAHHDDWCRISGDRDGLPGDVCSVRIGDQQRRTAVVQQVGHLGRDQTEVEGYGDGPEAHDASEGLDVLDPIGHEDPHAPAHADAEAGERRRDPVKTGVELLIGDTVAIRPQGDINRLHVRMPADEAGPGDGVRLQQLQLVTLLMVIHVHGVNSPCTGVRARSWLACCQRLVTSASSRANVSSMSRRVFLE